ncbi:hypothetical protein C0992_010391, partial [Termitomyces sp. T32_za158]
MPDPTRAPPRPACVLPSATLLPVRGPVRDPDPALVVTPCSPNATSTPPPGILPGEPAKPRSTRKDALTRAKRHATLRDLPPGTPGDEHIFLAWVPAPPYAYHGRHGEPPQPSNPMTPRPWGWDPPLVSRSSLPSAPIPMPDPTPALSPHNGLSTNATSSNACDWNGTVTSEVTVLMPGV